MGQSSSLALRRGLKWPSKMRTLGLIAKVVNWFKQNQRSGKARLQLEAGQSKFAQHDFEGAREHLLVALDTAADSPNTDIEIRAIDLISHTWTEQDRYEEAIAFLSDYLKKHPESLQARNNLGHAHWYSGALDTAIEWYSDVLTINPSDLGALVSRGQVYAELGNPQKALADLNLALESIEGVVVFRSPSDWRNWISQCEAYTRNGRALALGKSGAFEQSIAEFKLSMTLQPENAWAYFNRACIYDNEGKLTESEQDYRRALGELKPRLNPLKRDFAERRLHELQQTH
jgi:tetratricopeptide (TPR) repeat protein